MIDGSAGGKPDHKQINKGQGQDCFRSELDLAHAALASEDLDRALVHADNLIRAHPNELQGYTLRAQTLAAQQNREEALQTLRKALSAHPADSKLLKLARSIAFQHGEYDQAIGYALKLAEIAPSDRKNQALLIQSYLASGDLTNALHHADALIKAHTDEAQGPMLKARALVAQKRLDEALQTLRKALPAFEGNQKFLSLAKSIAFQHGGFSQAVEYSLLLSKIAPNDHKNRAFLIQYHLASGDFASALRDAQAFQDDFPTEPQGFLLRAQALVALHRVEEALQVLQDALVIHETDPKLLNFARSVAYQHGRFNKAIEYGLRLLKTVPDDYTNQAFIIQSYMASGDFAAAAKFLHEARSGSDASPLKKAELYYTEYGRLKLSYPAVTEAWGATLKRDIHFDYTTYKLNKDNIDATMIQYWSQGALPDDVGLVYSNWKSLFHRENLGRIELFNRTSAGSWIEKNAPEFSNLFSKAFHYAMESDIFRIAYASRYPCIYMDVDCWPLENTAEILRFGVQSKQGMLYLRSHRPWINNCFFVSTPESAFFRELVSQCLSIDLEEYPKNHVTIERTFGPTRYNKVLLDLVMKSNMAEASKVESVPGCSVLTLGEDAIYFALEAEIASVKPPFPLGYKATDAYWKGISLAD